MNQAIAYDRKSEVCPLCASADQAKGSFGLLRCQSCGLTIDPAVWRPQANEAFEHDWFGDEYDPEQSSWVRLFERWIDRRTVKRLASLNVPGKRLLEIGVGSGSFLRRARAVGFEVMGCDLSKSICARIECRFGIPMHCGYLAELPLQPLFDVVVMNHVLEHVSDPVSLLRDVRNRLVPGAILHVAVPNVACFEARLPGWASYEPYHLIYFTPETLRRTVVAAGFLIERELTHESFSGWFLAGLRTALPTRHSIVAAGARLAARKARAESPMEHAYRAAMVTFGTLTWPLRKVQAGLGKGDEAICIARIPGF